MITGLTGLPGSGKTLYAVSKLLRALVGAVVRVKDAQDVEADVPRVIYSNINGLLVDHVKIGPGAEWLYDGKTKKWSQPVDGDKLGLANWHEWAKPGAVIVFDEVQKAWPLAPAGSPVPPCIEALETHRHMGVDFIVMTQHPMMIHANLVRLMGRHLHVRRMGNMRLAVVYEWDGCSRTLKYKDALAKESMRYDKSAFELYKSAEVHTKQPRRIPTLVFGAIFALVAVAGMGPWVASRVKDRISPPPVVVKSVTTTLVEAPKAVEVGGGSPGEPAAPGGPVPVVLAPPSPVGCVSMQGRCVCFGAEGQELTLEPDACQSEVMRVRQVVFVNPAGSGLPRTPASGRVDGELPGPFLAYEPGVSAAAAPLPERASFAGADYPRPRPGIAP